MEVYRRSSWLLLLLGIALFAATLQGVQGDAETGPSESECRPFIEKALKSLETGETAPPGDGDSKEDIPTVEITTDDSDHEVGEHDTDRGTEQDESAEAEPTESPDSVEEDQSNEQTADDDDDDDDSEEQAESVEKEADAQSAEMQGDEPAETSHEDEEAAQGSEEAKTESKEDVSSEKADDVKSVEDEQSKEEEKAEGQDAESAEEDADDKSKEGAESQEEVKEEAQSAEEQDAKDSAEDKESVEEKESAEVKEGADDKESVEDDDEQKDEGKNDDEKASAESVEDKPESAEDKADSVEDKAESAEDKAESAEDKAESAEEEKAESAEEKADSVEEKAESAEDKAESAEEKAESAEEKAESAEDKAESAEDKAESAEDKVESVEDKAESAEDKAESAEDKVDSTADEAESAEDKAESVEEKVASVEEESSEKLDSEKPDEASKEDEKEEKSGEEEPQADEPAVDELAADEEASKEHEEEAEPSPEEELTQEFDIPTNLRPTDHISQLLKLDDESLDTEKIINKVADVTLRDLKKLYENAIKPLETLYKYRDLSNRHFGDSEIFSKPLVLFMGPWSGGKSSIINYLLDNEYNETSLRTGAEPSPAYFNILMHGDEPEVLDGTQLAADFTFSGLQKFGQGLEERLRGLKLPSKLLEKINIVEIPGILEVRKQVSRIFPFNDACQWFIDRADIIFLVYDPSKLDVGPETEAILDQLKGREYQTRIVLNKADQVKPEELMRVQGALIWNISPLMSSPQPPVMYTTSLWSRPYESWAPVRLLQAQERAFLRDLRSAIDKRIDNKISSARRFAVRVRNHAKMVDCYLTTYYNHKSVFGNKKLVSDQIIENPQDYHIYEGLSTLTNISRYDLPDPEVYRGFFKLNPLYDFQQLSATCTYFRGCPINRLDVAIAYDLPELVGKHKKLVESALAEVAQTKAPGS